MRRIGVVTVGRSDFGLYLPLLRRLEAHRDVALKLFVSGAHLLGTEKKVALQVEEAGYHDYIAVKMLVQADDPTGIGVSMGRGVSAFSKAYSQWRPDVLVVLGDRFEMHAAALAALPHNIPVAHIHGGEITEGAIDDCLRHSMTKLSHLHFASTRQYARRIRQMGEEGWRVKAVGAIGLDNLTQIKIPDRRELSRRLKWTLPPEFLLVTYHPVTLEADRVAEQGQQLLEALRRSKLPVLFTAPNADTHGQRLSRLIKLHVQSNPDCLYVENLGTENYFAAMAAASAMVGNSSSGIIEAASFRLPVVNIGLRQAGRLRPANVIDCGYGTEEIVRALRRATSVEFKRRIRRCRNPYYAGGAAEHIVKSIRTVPLGRSLIWKKFCDAPGSI